MTTDNPNIVPVLDSEGRPLMPTKPSRARRWMLEGKACKRWHKGVFLRPNDGHQRRRPGYRGRWRAAQHRPRAQRRPGWRW